MHVLELLRERLELAPMVFLNAPNDPSPELAHGKKDNNKTRKRVTSVKTNRATHELGLVVMRVGIFCNFLTLKLCGKYF
jgi:hypothetical protein